MNELELLEEIIKSLDLIWWVMFSINCSIWACAYLIVSAIKKKSSCEI